jgi:glucose-6-phosphate 1-dehydrogenase
VFDGNDVMPRNYFRLRLSPEVVIGAGALVKRSGEHMRGEPVELIARHSAQNDMSPYERLLGDAIRGDPSLFTQDACVEAAWRVVDPVLRDPRPVIQYEPGTWGPAEADQVIEGDETWHNPTTETSTPC